LKCDGTRAETRFLLSAKWTSPFKSSGPSVQSITGSRGVRISGITMFRGSVKSTGYPLKFASFPLHFPSRASPCAITFQLDPTSCLSATTVVAQTCPNVTSHANCLPCMIINMNHYISTTHQNMPAMPLQLCSLLLIAWFVVSGLTL